MAKKSQSINVVTSDFSRAMREMSRITGFSFADIIRAETKSILEAAAKTNRRRSGQTHRAKRKGTPIPLAGE